MAAFEPWIALIPKIHLYPCASSALDCGANKFHPLLKSVKVSRRHGVEERQRTGFHKRGDLMCPTEADFSLFCSSVVVTTPPAFSSVKVHSSVLAPPAGVDSGYSWACSPNCAMLPSSLDQCERPIPSAPAFGTPLDQKVGARPSHSNCPKFSEGDLAAFLWDRQSEKLPLILWGRKGSHANTIFL